MQVSCIFILLTSIPTWAWLFNHKVKDSFHLSISAELQLSLTSFARTELDFSRMLAVTGWANSLSSTLDSKPSFYAMLYCDKRVNADCHAFYCWFPVSPTGFGSASAVSI